MSDPFRLFEFEISGDAAEADAGGDYGGDDGGYEGGYEGESEASEPQYLTAEDIQPLLQYQQATMPVFQQLQEALSAEEQELFGDDVPEQQAAQPDFDPFDPNVVANLANQVAAAQVQAAIEPFQGLLGMMATEKGEQLAQAALDEIEEQIGEFDHDTTFLIANSMMNDPNNQQDPATTLATVAQWVQQREQEIGEAAIEAYKQELQGLAGASRDAPAGGGSATPVEGVPTGRGADKYRALVSQFQSRQSPYRVVG